MMDDRLKHPPFRRRVETDDLVNHLKTLKVGILATYEALSELVGIDIEVKYRNLLDSARHILIRDHQINFEPVPGKGVVRTRDEETLQSVDHMFRSINRKAKKAKEKTGCINYKSLSVEHQRAFLARVSLANVVNGTTRKPAILQLETAIEPDGKELGLKATLAFYLGKSL